MNVISRRTLERFFKKHVDSKGALLTWYHKTAQATWTGPQDIKNEYSHASFLEKNRVIFNIKGKKYRLVVSVSYKSKTVFVKWIGTHSEYNKKKF
jgi:mRNA interferase HigB